MEDIVKFDSVEDYIIELRGEKVILMRLLRTTMTNSPTGM